MGLYSYINLKELYELNEKKRISFVVVDVQCKDIDEYINNCIITLQNSGLNINLMTRPKIYKSSSKVFNIVLTFKHTIKHLENNQKIALISWADDIGNVESLKEYLKFNNKVKSVELQYYDILQIFRNKYNFYINFLDRNKKIYTAKLKFIYTGDRIVAIDIIFNNKYKNYRQSVDSLEHGFYDMIAKSCRKAYRDYKLHPDSVLVDNGNIINKLKVDITLDGVELTHFII